MPVYQNGKIGEVFSQQAVQSPAQNVEVQSILSQLAALAAGMAAVQGVQLQGGAEVDPAESLQRLAEVASRIDEGGVVEDGIGDTNVVKGDEKNRNTLDLLRDL